MTDIKTLDKLIDYIEDNCIYSHDWEFDRAKAKQALNLYIEGKIKEELEQVVRVGLPYAKIRIKELQG